MTIPHGTITGYNKGKCRCAACRAAKTEANRRYWAKRGRAPIGNPCRTPDGRMFPTQSAAAMALGVSQQAISFHLAAHGDLSRVRIRVRHLRGGVKKPIRIGVREWPSRADLARYLEVPDYSVRDWLRRRDMERLTGALMRADAKAANVKEAA